MGPGRSIDIDLSYDYFKTLEAGLPRLKGLRHLFLFRTNLAALPETIKDLSKLELLNINGNRIEAFPKVICQLQSLKYLCIDPHCLKAVPEEVGKLEELHMLAINPVDKLFVKDGEVYFPERIGLGIDIEVDELYKFSQIEKLDLSGVKRDIIESIDFSRFPRLKHLGLFGCKLNTIPPSIFQLTDLEHLELGNSQITAFPEQLFLLKKLRYLQLMGNEIREIPKNIHVFSFYEKEANLPYLNSDWLGLDLRKNPIDNVPHEIIAQGFAAIKNYFTSIEAGKTTSFNSAKLMIVGRGRVGKTSLLKKLIDPEYNVVIGKEDSTRGIDISKWSFKNKEEKVFDARIWDFGGQQNYYTPHQFFLTRRSLYILVWDAMHEEDQLTFGYWLNLIKVLSDESPVILVMNKADERTKSIDEAGLKKMFPNIVNFHKVSCINGTGIDVLREEIIAEFSRLPHVNDQLSFTWKYVRENLEKKSKTTDFISTDTYYSICAKRDLDKEKANFLSQYLHDLGTIIHFNNNLNLRNTVILNPDWLTKAVYAVIDDKKIIENQGHFTNDDLDRVWKNNYPGDKYSLLLNLMEMFELCFSTDQGRKHTLPILLSPQMPEINWTSEESLNFEYEYSFMPTGIMTKFIVRNNDSILGDSVFWKHGVFLLSDALEALIKEDRLKKRISIQIRGKGDKKAYLSWLRKEIETINESFSNLEVEQQIPCNCPECIDSNDPHLFKHSSLLKRKEKNKRTVECDQSFEQVSIIGLLDGVGLETMDASRTGKIQKARPAKQESYKKVLFLASNPSKTAKEQLTVEHSAISEQLQNSIIIPKIERAVTLSNMQKFILREKPSIIHFSGHGTNIEENILKVLQASGQTIGTINDHFDTGIFLWSEDLREPFLLKTEVIRHFFKSMVTIQKIPIETVIFNSCHSDIQATAIAEFVPNVVGTSYSVKDDAAIGFSTGFYLGLAENRSILQSVNLGMTNAMSKGIPPDRFVLYQNGKRVEL
jgi:internalin A